MTSGSGTSAGFEEVAVRFVTAWGTTVNPSPTGPAAMPVTVTEARTLSSRIVELVTVKIGAWLMKRLWMRVMRFRLTP